MENKTPAAGAAPQENKMGVLPIGRLLAGMAIPMMISMLVQALYNVVDSVFVAMLSENALNACLLYTSVGITAGCDAVDAVGAAITGVIFGIVIVLSVEFFDKVAKIDDPVGAISVHEMCIRDSFGGPL